MNERNGYGVLGRMYPGEYEYWRVVGEREERYGGIKVPPNHPGSTANLQAKAQ